jgi:hypothetical protein
LTTVGFELEEKTLTQQHETGFYGKLEAILA